MVLYLILIVGLIFYIIYLEFYKNHSSKILSDSFILQNTNSVRKKSKDNNIHDKIKIINNFCKLLIVPLKNEVLKKVYVIDNILTKNECKWIIDESEKYASINGWRQERPDLYTLEDNIVMNISSIFYFVYNIIFTKILKHFEIFYNIPSEFLGINDCYIIKYSESNIRSLKSHVDRSDFSLIITLNDNFEGGYTYFDLLKKKYSAGVGSALIFCGKNKHTGLEITKGTRYILVAFFNLKNRDYCNNMINT